MARCFAASTAAAVWAAVRRAAAVAAPQPTNSTVIVWASWRSPAASAEAQAFATLVGVCVLSLGACARVARTQLGPPMARASHSSAARHGVLARVGLMWCHTRCQNNAAGTFGGIGWVTSLCLTGARGFGGSGGGVGTTTDVGVKAPTSTHEGACRERLIRVARVWPRRA